MPELVLGYWNQQREKERERQRLPSSHNGSHVELHATTAVA